MSEAELAAAAADLIAHTMPRPRPAAPFAVSGQHMFTAAGLDLLAAQYASSGIGPVAGGRAMLCAPDLFAPVLAVLPALSVDGPVYALAYTAFGAVSLVSRGGNDILVDPLTPNLKIFPPEADDDLAFQVTFAGRVSMAIEDGRPSDRLIDLDAKDLFRSVRPRLGHLRHGQCYASQLSPDDPDMFRPDSFRIVDIVDHLLWRHRVMPFRIAALEGGHDHDQQG
jgi:hypothetical protein